MRVILHYFVTARAETTTPDKHHRTILDPFLAEIAIAIMLINQLNLGSLDLNSKRKLSSLRIDFFPVLVPVILKNMQTYYA
jgi:hypothetical protein